ncbi:MAG: GTP-binding protein [Sulfolobales archaeon]|nr:P-loop NTPase fold protein [Sulfolobales archaeon]MDW8083294.1 GTP-binding protein [Sulfolobales archaeon]
MSRVCVELSDRVALSKVLTVAETNSLEILSRLSECLVREPRSAVIGITGPQGVGKSTVISSLIRELSSEGLKVAALLVDPSSPITGGAVLGNRLRISELPSESFARSIWAEDERAIPLRAIASLEILEAAGYDYIFIETPGAGQVNTSILRISDLVLVILMPFLGDEVQVIKAGLMEIGDIYIVNKADVPEADLMYNYVKSLVREKPLVKISALYKKNINELVKTIETELKKRDSEGRRAVKRVERRKYLIEETLIEQIHKILHRELREVREEELLKKPGNFIEIARDLKARLANKIVEGP